MEVLTQRCNQLRKYNVMSLKDVTNKISNMKSEYFYKLKNVEASKKLVTSTDKMHTQKVVWFTIMQLSTATCSL